MNPKGIYDPEFEAWLKRETEELEAWLKRETEPGTGQQLGVFTTLILAAFFFVTCGLLGWLAEWTMMR